MNTPRFGSGQPLPPLPLSIDSTILLSRMEAMGLGSIRDTDLFSGSPSASDVLPWWLLEVFKKDQCRVPLAHLSSLMAQHRFGLRAGSFSLRPMQTFFSGLPLGSPEVQAKTLHRLLMGLIHLGESADEDDIVTLLCGIAHLETSIGSNTGWFSSASQALVKGKAPHEEAHRSIAHLATLHGFEDMDDTLGRILEIGEMA